MTPNLDRVSMGLELIAQCETDAFVFKGNVYRGKPSDLIRKFILETEETDFEKFLYPHRREQLDLFTQYQDNLHASKQIICRYLVVAKHAEIQPLNKDVTIHGKYVDDKFTILLQGPLLTEEIDVQDWQEQIPNILPEIAQFIIDNKLI